MLVFSSSATVYGQPEKVLCVEDFELKATNPYGRTKAALGSSRAIASNIDITFCSFSLKKLLETYQMQMLSGELFYLGTSILLPHTRLGEDPKGIPNNIMRYIQQVAVGRLPELNVYGANYPTKDSTADSVVSTLYENLAKSLLIGSLQCLTFLSSGSQAECKGCVAYNLGTGHDASVLEMVAAFEKASGKVGSLLFSTSISPDGFASVLEHELLHVLLHI
ncbi:hypothetical protein Ancab_032624 [Ancistrocladus abbreviatus]